MRVGPSPARARAIASWATLRTASKFAAYLLEHNLVNQDELTEIERKVEASIDDAVKFAEESPEPDPSELYRYVFAEDK